MCVNHIIYIVEYTYENVISNLAHFGTLEIQIKLYCQTKLYDETLISEKL